MAEVVLEQVSKIYPGNVRAVDRINLHIRDQEFIILVGPSGCGKSTTLRMVAGLEDISEGTIRIGDRVVNGVAAKDRDIAMVFQNYALYPHMSVYKNMAFGLKLRGLPKAEIDQKVRHAAELLGIEPLLERKPRALSGGQRQRVALGRAIVRTPKAFLFDEPLSNLDAKLRVEMRAELKKLHRRLATTTIYVTHDQEEAMTLGDRVVVMKDGIMLQCATPLELYHRPVNRFVAGFIGTPPMNFFDGQITAQNGKLYFDSGTGLVRLPENLTAAAGEHRGRAVVMGVRPEDFSHRSEGLFAGGENVLDARISVIETLGRDMDLYVEMGGRQAICRVPADGQLAEGASLPMYINIEEILLFEPGENGLNLGLNPEQRELETSGTRPS